MSKPWICVELDSPIGIELGFTSDKFAGYLGQTSDSVYISAIESLHKKQGNFKRLVKNILRKGLKVKVPTPSNEMRRICEKNGFVQTWEWFDEADENCKVLVMEAKEGGD